MAEQSACGLRQRRKSGLPLNTEGGSQVNDADNTPTPTAGHAKTLNEFKNKQQSFDIAIQFGTMWRNIMQAAGSFMQDNPSPVRPARITDEVEECDEEEIALDSDDEGPEEKVARRPVTPTPLQDFGVSVQHQEVPMTATEFLKVNPVEQDCFTDVSDAEDEGEEE